MSGHSHRGRGHGSRSALDGDRLDGHGHAGHCHAGSIRRFDRIFAFTLLRGYIHRNRPTTQERAGPDQATTRATRLPVKHTHPSASKRHSHAAGDPDRISAAQRRLASKHRRPKPHPCPHATPYYTLLPVYFPYRQSPRRDPQPPTPSDRAQARARRAHSSSSATNPPPRPRLPSPPPLRQAAGRRTDTQRTRETAIAEPLHTHTETHTHTPPVPAPAPVRWGREGRAHNIPRVSSLPRFRHLLLRAVSRRAATRRHQPSIDPPCPVTHQEWPRLMHQRHREHCRRRGAAIFAQWVGARCERRW